MLYQNVGTGRRERIHIHVLTEDRLVDDVIGVDQCTLSFRVEH